MDSETTFDLDKHIYKMLRDEPFFCALSRELDKVEDESIPTAGVRLNRKRACYELVYNPKFLAGEVESLPLDPVKGPRFVLKHELFHIALGHTDFRYRKDISHKIQNVAQDAAINSLTSMRVDAPDWCIMPGRAPFEDLPTMEAPAEFYLQYLIKKQEQEEQNKDKSGEGESGDGEQNSEGNGGGSGGDTGQSLPEHAPGVRVGDGSSNGSEAPDGQFDSHEAFGDEEDSEDQAAKDIARERLKDAVKKAADTCDQGAPGQAAGWGSMHAAIRERIRAYAKKDHGIDPRKVLGSFIKASVRSSKRSSVTKRSRRLPGLKFGKKIERQARIAVSIDQSGSVNDEMFYKFYEILGSFTKIADIVIIPFDDKVFEDKIFTWKKGEKRPAKRVLSGGTNFDSPTDYVNKNNFDGHIIMTDMMAPKPKRSVCQRMWLTDSHGMYYKSAAGSENILVMK